MSVHVVIPARMASTRLPEKPLADIAGTPMIVRVARQASLAPVDNVVVAVDDRRVLDVVEAAGYQAVLTAIDHTSGSDRVMEVAELMEWQPDDIVINVQGDEPLLPPGIITQLAEVMRGSQHIEMATLSEPIHSSDDFLDPNIVKVVTNALGCAMYFSRAPIPFPRDAMATTTLTDRQVQSNRVQRHVGVYAFRVAALQDFTKMTDSRFESIECLEQLRWLEEGRQIYVLESSEAIPGGVDTPADLLRVEEILRAGS